MSARAQSLMIVDDFLGAAEEREGRRELENGVAYAMAPERLTHARVKGDRRKKFLGYFSLPSVVHYPLLDTDERVLVHHQRVTSGAIDLFGEA